MKRLALAVALLVAMTGCVTTPAPVTIRNDPRTGTEHSPYRSVPVVIQCDDCRY